ncbi:related to glucan 1,3-beta-glucosidase [Rhynchosporium graminicola]|uniref:glucan endo-1,3-beta-D-glucosidase n=1 Tax=Rhynchosporium graminicola TaxID=2792576 RepID=A0A1E1LSK5_9HELO|nr:related to glucan 1,3-beta-glucosidase [Rhynchosporium commune]
MKESVWLTMLQAAAVVAAPPHRNLHRRQLGNFESTTTITDFVTETATITVTVTVLPQTENSAPSIILTPGNPSPPASETLVLVPITRTPTEGVFLSSICTSTVTADVSVITTSSSSGTAQVLPTLSTTNPNTSGTVMTSLRTSGYPSSAPIISTSISAPSTTISPTVPVTLPPSPVEASMPSQNIFQPVATEAPPPVIGRRTDHPVPRLGIKPQSSPVGTNKFYENFFLGSQSSATWTHPYSVAWVRGNGASKSWGMSITHLDYDQKVYGPDPDANPVKYFANPVGIQSLVLSALELGESTTLSTDSLTAFSVKVNLSPSAGAAPAISFPLVQGMGFITGIFTGGTPILQTGVFFRSITKATSDPKRGITKYTIHLEDGKTWLLYAYSADGSSLEFTVVNSGLAQATSNFNGIIQIAKNPGNAEAIYDAACGAYATTTVVSGSTTGSAASYTLSFSKGGLADTTLVMFALPHLTQSFSSRTASAMTDLDMATTTKGFATAVVADSWTMEETLPTSMGFAPWSPQTGSSEAKFSSSAAAAIQAIAASEVSQDMSTQTNLDSMYFGKALAKFAGIVYTIHDLLGDQALAQAGLNKLKQAFARFTQNSQTFPLVYETAWGGIVSSASYETGNAGADFGNTYYNDHHFHYGYFVYTASVIGYLDPSWLPENKPWVNALVRDYANPSSADPYFPVYRNFDWYHGHSWAHGLYESADGLDQESSSEDSMSAYALKMWGRTIGDANLEARGNLQLAITARSLQNYYLYTSDNNVQPQNFIENKVAGILFENKVDHTTFFGTKIEFIQGIHMLPLLPSSALTRTSTFVQEEWDTYFSDGRADAAEGGWKSVLYSNLALSDPKASWRFFTQPNFDASWLDGGASRTWYMAIAAGLGGA